MSSHLTSCVMSRDVMSSPCISRYTGHQVSSCPGNDSHDVLWLVMSHRVSSCLVFSWHVCSYCMSFRSSVTTSSLPAYKPSWRGRAMFLLTQSSFRGKKKKQCTFLCLFTCGTEFTRPSRPARVQPWAPASSSESSPRSAWPSRQASSCKLP